MPSEDAEKRKKALYIEEKLVQNSKTSSKLLGIMENFQHCVKSVRIWSYSGPYYLSVFSPNVGKCGAK